MVALGGILWKLDNWRRLLEYFAPAIEHEVIVRRNESEGDSQRRLISFRLPSVPLPPPLTFLFSRLSTKARHSFGDRLVGPQLSAPSRLNFERDRQVIACVVRRDC